MILSITSISYAQNQNTINLIIETPQQPLTIMSATGQDIAMYNADLGMIVADELKTNNKNVNLIGMSKKGDDSGKVMVSNNTNSNLDIKIGFGSQPIEELKFWEYQGKKLRYSDDVHGFSIFVNAAHDKFKIGVMCAKAVAEKLMKVGFKPNWSYNRDYQLIFANYPIYQTEKDYFIKNSNHPSFRIEPGVLTNRQETQWFERENVNVAFAKSITMGVSACLDN